ncbi:MAG: DUF2282 domain-containing protein [Rhodospirillaceae bacterium]
MDKKTLAVAVAGAVALAGQIAPAAGADAGKGKGKEKCFGVAVAGENGCAAADGSHGCGGLSTVDYSGKEWVLVAGGSCEKMGGKLEAFDGIGKPPAPGAKSNQTDKTK